MIEKWVDRAGLSGPSNSMKRYFIVEYLVTGEPGTNLLMKFSNKLELFNEMDLLIKSLKENPGLLEVMIPLFQSVLANRVSMADGENSASIFAEELKECLLKYKVEQAVSQQLLRCITWKKVQQQRE